jgi:hypothetical protein
MENVQHGDPVVNQPFSQFRESLQAGSTLS